MSNIKNKNFGYEDAAYLEQEITFMRDRNMELHSTCITLDEANEKLLKQIEQLKRTIDKISNQDLNL